MLMSVLMSFGCGGEGSRVGTWSGVGGVGVVCWVQGEDGS